MALIFVIPLLCVLCWQLWQHGYYGFNVPLFQFINSTAPHSDWLWQNITFLGDGLPAAALLIFCCRRNAHLLWLGILGAIITGLALQICKHVADFMRPPAYLGVEHIHLIGKALNHHSFPSGHSATAFLMACVLGHYAKRLPAPYAQTLPILLVLMASLIAYSRVVVGVHWPADVIVGSIWGWYSGKLILWISARTSQIGQTTRSANILYMLGAIVAVVLWSFADKAGYPLAAPLAKIISASALLFLFVVVRERKISFKLNPTTPAQD